jgi:hydroxymethylpyrimidine/phosphomethylpyrimidine kinase
MKDFEMHTPTVLAIAGSDPYGGAGIQIDAKTIHAMGAYALTATTAITAQNSQGVFAVEALSPEMLHLQLNTLLKDIKVDAVKIGMLANAALVEVVVDVLKKYELSTIVLDPVMISSSGKALLESDAVEMMVKELFPLCSLITPNLMETNILLGTNYLGKKEESLAMAEGHFALGANAVLLKGGHSCEEEAVDCLVDPSGMVCFASPRVETTHTHGTGCILSSAIATQLAHKRSLKASVENAKNFLYEKLQTSDILHLQYISPSAMRKEPIF